MSSLGWATRDPRRPRNFSLLLTCHDGCKPKAWESQDLTGPVIEQFLTVRRRDYSNLYSMQALEPLLAILAADRGSHPNLFRPSRLRAGIDCWPGSVTI